MRCDDISLCTWWCDDYIDVVNKCFRFVNVWFWWWWIICDVLHNANMMRWYIYLDVDKVWRCGLYANFDERWWCFCCVVLLSSHIHCIGDEGFYAKRRGLLCQATRLLCQATMGFIPSVPNHAQSDGYHMHNIVVSHGVGYVYVWVVWRWVLIDGWC